MMKPRVDNSASGRTIALGNGPVYEPPPASICTAPGLMAAGRSEQAPTAGTLEMSRTNGYARRSRRTERPPLSRVATGYYRHVPIPARVAGVEYGDRGWSRWSRCAGRK